MTAEQRALRPLWLLATGAVSGSAAALAAPNGAAPPLAWVVTLLGAAAIVTTLLNRRWWGLWLVAGLALAGGRGLLAQSHVATLGRVMAANDASAIRARMAIREGWTRTRWGWRSRVSVLDASHRDRPLRLMGRCGFELRGDAASDELPPPGSVIDSLVTLRGEPDRPLLVAASPRLLDRVGAPRGLARFRDRLASSLLDSAGTHVGRIRSAELAAALALGRRDLLPWERRDGWRRSGLAHLLAVSGLHVGLVWASLWLAMMAAGVRPRRARLVVLTALPVYAVLAGASPSAVRAALMGMIYLGGRLLGRAVIPMAAVLLAASILLVAQPRLVADAGFQLTVLITAALVRWVPRLAERIPGPLWLSGAISVPLVAQLAAAPIVAWHFRSLIPGAVASNLLVPPLLAPTLLAALLATLTAPLLPAIAALLLDAMGFGVDLLWLCSTPGRAFGLTLPGVPIVSLCGLVVAGWLSLQSSPRARHGVSCWLGIIAATAAWWVLRPGPPADQVELLPVAEGLAATLSGSGGVTLVDGGRWKREATELLVDGGLRSLSLVIASHTDEDHLAGLRQVLRELRVGQFVFPAWMRTEAQTVPLLRAARSRGILVRRVSQGSALEAGGLLIEILWPPEDTRVWPENERSLVARAELSTGTVLVTADVGRYTELRLSRRGGLQSEVLLAPHHGSRHSSSPALIEAVQPRVVLIPAGPHNLHGHPHSEVLERLDARAIPYRYPARDGRCGARYIDGRWVVYP